MTIQWSGIILACVATPMIDASWGWYGNDLPSFSIILKIGGAVWFHYFKEYSQI